MANYETAFAKINLTLHVRRRRSDGYHDIETLFAFADSGDVIEAQPSDALNLHVTGPFAAGLSNTDNLVLDAARALQDFVGYSGGAALTLDKCLPVASGIGGGSADAAAAMRLLNRMWDLELSQDVLAEIGAPLGADIPACIYSQAMHGTGTGTVLMPAERGSISGKKFLLVNPMVDISTPEVFSRWGGADDGPMGEGNSLDIALSGSNGLQVPAIELCPQIGDLLGALNCHESILARMSGSGATCFAIYGSDDARDAALNIIQRKFPEYWTLAGEIR